MNLYDEIYRVANELEKTRLMYLENIQEVKESNSYVEVGKPDILEELCINGEVIYKYEVR